jgi:hypothetical protein
MRPGEQPNAGRQTWRVLTWESFNADLPGMRANYPLSMKLLWGSAIMGPAALIMSDGAMPSGCA